MAAPRAAAHAGAHGHSPGREIAITSGIAIAATTVGPRECIRTDSKCANDSSISAATISEPCTPQVDAYEISQQWKVAPAPSH